MILPYMSTRPNKKGPARSTRTGQSASEAEPKNSEEPYVGFTTHIRERYICYYTRELLLLITNLFDCWLGYLFVGADQCRNRF
jgi:hypothetical protein